MHPNIHTIAISITTHCNMRCPECCCGMQVIPKEDKYFASWDYMVNAAKYFYGVETICLTGGEPSIHPEVLEWSPKLKELFGCKYLNMNTNGTMFKKVPELFSFYDNLYVTHYTQETYEGCVDNTDKILFLQHYFSERIYNVPELHISQPMEHINRSKRGNGSCFRATSGNLGYVDGKLYPCCVASGIDEDSGIALTDNWKDMINEVNPPCNKCFFADEV